MDRQAAEIRSGWRGGQFGLTLVELALVLGLVAVMSALAAPSFRSMWRTVLLDTQSSLFLGHLYLARSEAIKRRARVVMCKSSDGTRCDDQGGWDQGWIVFHDANNDAHPDPGEAIVARSQTGNTSIRVTGNLQVARYVSYTPTGVARLTSGAFQAGTITLCVAESGIKDARRIILSSSGRPRLSNGTVSSCP